MKGSNAPNLQRIAYHEGQLLSARDLSDDAAYEGRLRGLHMRGAHNTWGVALGFDVSRVNDRFLRVGPGIAYDALGREIISSRTFTLGMPVVPKTAATAHWFDLVIGYLSTATQPGQGDCARSGDEDGPRWRWSLAGAAGANLPMPGLPDDVRLGEEIPLVRCLVMANGTLGPQLDFSLRRETQGMVRPHIGSGHPALNAVFDTQQRAYSALVDTSAGGFSQTPAYFARIRVPALLSFDGAQDNLPLGPFVTIRNAGRTSFRLDVRFAFNQSNPGIVAFAAATQVPTVAVEVDWIGVEATGGCAPPVSLFSPLFLFFTPSLATQLILGQGALIEAVEGGFNG